MTNKHNPLVKAIRTALLAGVAASLVVAPTAFAADADDEDEAENTVTVTGSRIKRSDFEGALPVTVIDRDMIEMSGESNASDFLRNLTFNSAGSFRPQSGSSAQGVSTISLRGIGASRTLVLVDGRRLPKSPSTGSSQDLNTIPLGAIERIEILSDGASAVYGSDAMGGVVNIITRQDFEGAEITLGSSSVSIPANGGDREQGSIVFGAASSTSSLMGGVSWNKRDIIFARDFYFNQGGASVYGNSYTTINPNGSPNFDWRSIPDGAGGTACDFPGTAFFTLGARCAFDFTEVSADEASTGNTSLWLKARHQFNDDWEVWTNATISKSSSFGRYAPVPDSSYFSTALPGDSVNNPTNPNGNVWNGIDTVGVPVHWWHRFDALGNRDNNVDNELSDLQTGIIGTVNDIDLDFGIRITKNITNSIGRNYLLRSAAAAAITSGAYDLRNPHATDPNILNGMKVTTSRISQYNQNELFFTASFDLFEMDSGTAQMAAGVEYREEDYNDQYDSLSEAGQVGGSSGNSAGGTRDVTAYYFEALLPVMENLEISIAGRQDDYSDYGSDFSPKISARWQVNDELTLRASIGQGFRAPTLDILTQLDSFSADSVNDPVSCVNQNQPPTCILQINGLRTANPELGAEQSDQISAGLAYQPTDWFNLTLDYYSIEIEERIRFFDAQTLINLTNAGDPIPTGLGVERTANGSILRIVQGFGNEGTLEVSGVDINAVFNYELFGGQMSHNVQLSHMLSTSLDGGRDLIKDPGTPEQRMGIATSYSYGDFSIGYNLNMIGSQFDDVTANGTGGVDRTGNVPTWITHDVQFNYFTPWQGRLTVGVRNAGEKRPPIGLGNTGSRDYDFTLYDAYGRITYVKYTQTF
ncbi:MAG: TonB-dependent receptor [Gammaproteobacteria bacterium]|nr:MAG: TonB-dependent receptor [Gammaproteobacteria bacterium]